MNEKQLLQFKLSANDFISVWTEFCQEHTTLYDLTCEEYVHLLSSDIDKLEGVVDLKNSQLNLISSLDIKRKDVLETIFSIDPKLELKKIKDVVKCLKENNLDFEANQLSKLNLLLLDIIEKIQDQSKKNQLFLNKAIISLKDLKRSFTGKTNYTTYGSNGATRTTVTP